MSGGKLNALASVGAPASAEVSVLLFSVLRDHIGANEIAVTVPPPATGTTLLDALSERFPVIRDYRSVVRLAVNQRYAALDAVLNDGDEVALITPVSGG